MPEPTIDEQTLLDEQIRYYRARAAEYDATSLPPDGPIAAALTQVRASLESLGIGGRVLELAGGTGLWTGLLAERATELTVVDASVEMLALNAGKTRDDRVRYVVSDVFALVPDGAWDVVFFSAWLSHVPAGRFDDFWKLVRGLLAPGGRAIVVDEAAPGLGGEDWLDQTDGVVSRQLKDGSYYRAVKVLWRPDELEARLGELGWDATVYEVAPFFWGIARLAV
jgi:demethylmenaquinone methyltransferase/2-methoxy-6-polyprenyl-1,4-benzoquinol methylase